jgi:hypothetical protein
MADKQKTAKAVEETEPIDIWEAAEDAKIPDDAWEYQIRKSLNDAAFNGLNYVPYCSTMPVQKNTETPKFIWRKKGAH